jgi:hypothetical protein
MDIGAILASRRLPNFVPLARYVRQAKLVPPIGGYVQFRQSPTTGLEITFDANHPELGCRPDPYPRSLPRLCFCDEEMVSAAFLS